MATVIIYMVVEQLFLHRIPQVDIFVEEEMLLEEEHVVAGLAGQAAPRRPVLVPLGHDVRHLLVSQQAALLLAQHLGHTQRHLAVDLTN